MRAALAKIRRMKRITVAELNKIKRSFERDWQNAVHVHPTELLISRAEILAYTNTPLPLIFAGFDATLNDAARKMGLALFDDV